MRLSICSWEVMPSVCTDIRGQRAISDFWISRDEANAKRVFDILVEFGFNSPVLSASLFTLEKSIVRMGVAPFKVEVITHIDGVTFDDCYPNRLETEIDAAR